MQLTEIEGIGPKKAKSLIDYFKDINKIATASVDELMDVSGINENNAKNIYEFYHNS